MPVLTLQVATQRYHLHFLLVACAIRCIAGCCTHITAVRAVLCCVVLCCVGGDVTSRQDETKAAAETVLHRFSVDDDGGVSTEVVERDEVGRQPRLLLWLCLTGLVDGGVLTQSGHLTRSMLDHEGAFFLATSGKLCVLVQRVCVVNCFLILGVSMVFYFFFSFCFLLPSFVWVGKLAGAPLRKQALVHGSVRGGACLAG